MSLWDIQCSELTSWPEIGTETKTQRIHPECRISFMATAPQHLHITAILPNHGPSIKFYYNVIEMCQELSRPALKIALFSVST